MKKWLMLVMAVVALAGCGGQNAPTSRIDLTPGGLLYNLSEVTGIQSTMEIGHNEKGNETISIEYEFGAVIKGVLNPDRTFNELVAMFIQDGKKNNAWKREKLLKGLVQATNRKMSDNDVSSLTRELLRKAANNKGKMQKADIGNVRYGIAAIPPKMTLLVIIPADAEWPSEVRKKNLD